MVITQTTANFLITSITLLFAYCIVVTAANFVQAWFAHIMGDDTPAQSGFLSLNPLDQIDPIGIICVVFFQFGWSNYVPINPSNLYGRWYKTKLAWAFLSGPVMFILLALIALITLIILFDVRIILITQWMIAHRELSYQIVISNYPLYNSHLVALGFILISIMYFGVILGVLNGIVNSFYLGMTLMHDKSPHMMTRHNNMALLFAPIVLLIFLWGPLRMLVIYALSCGAYFFTTLLGLV
jgi:hypothetical protein